jgi:hypothetical protein
MAYRTRIAVLLFLLGALIFCIPFYNGTAYGASNERLGEPPDRVRQLLEAGREDYCEVLAEFWDDGTWAASMGIANVILDRPADYVPPRDPADLQRDGIRRFKAGETTEREMTWYAFLFHAGWLAGHAFMAEHPEALVADPHDFSGVIPLEARAALKQGRFEKCLREWPPREV